jgi:DNA-binding NtrC family response regulator
MSEAAKSTILVVEDNERVRRSLVLGLKHFVREDIGIIQATTKKEALNVIESIGDNIALVITDVDIPESHDVGGTIIGDDAGNSVAAGAIEKGIPTIIFTASHLAIKAEVRSGCLGIINKPCDMQTLLKLIPKHLLKQLTLILTP